MTKWADRITAITLFIIAGVWLLLAVQLPFPAFSRISKMGPGHYPLAVAGVLAVLAIILLAQTFLGKATHGPDSPGHDDFEAGTETRNPKAVQHLITGFALFLCYIVSIPSLGFVAVSPLFVFLFLRFIGRFKLLFTITIAVCIPALLWTIFAFWLAVPLPKGPWGF